MRRMTMAAIWRASAIAISLVMSTPAGEAAELVDTTESVGPWCQTGPVMGEYKHAREKHIPLGGDRCLVLGTENEWYNGRSPAIYRRRPGRLIYQPSIPTCIDCIEVFRDFQFAFSVEIQDEHSSKSQAVAAKADDRITFFFDEAVKENLAPFADVGTPNLPPELSCYDNRRKPSKVLPSPYFEDVEYCVTLVRVDGRNRPQVSSDIRSAGAPQLYRLQTEIVAAVAINPNSAYRQPTLDEDSQYSDALYRITNSVEATIKEKLTNEGWLIEGERPFIIFGHRP